MKHSTRTKWPTTLIPWILNKNFKCFQKRKQDRNEKSVFKGVKRDEIKCCAHSLVFRHHSIKRTKIVRSHLSRSNRCILLFARVATSWKRNVF